MARTTFVGVCGLAAVLLAGGCSYSSPTAKVRAPFVPPQRRAVLSAMLPEPPAISAAATTVEITPILRESLEVSRARQEAEKLVQQAYLRLQKGRTYYQVNDTASARNEFDGAVDLMFAASAEDPADRQQFSIRLDEMVDTIHRLDLTGLGASDSAVEGQFDQAPLEDILTMTFPVDPKMKAKVRDEVAATVSQLPLTVNDVVLGYINYFSHRGHGTIVNALERSGRYRPMIQRILDEEGLPQEIIHLAQAESGFYARAMSRMAAGGMWQFVKFRGNEYGLKQTPYTDDRMDPEKATRAAAHHLHDLYDEFGDWYLALAAYNCGPNVVEDAVARTGYADFWELRSRGVLPAETTNYVPIILAMTIMEKYPGEYGLEHIQMDPPLEYDTVELTAKTSMALVSDIIDAPLPELADLNPAVLKSTIPADFAVHVPKGSGTQLMAGLEMIPPEHRDAWRIHRLAPGETIAEVAKRYGITLNSLQAANNLQSADANEGDRLIIPAAARPDAPPARKPATAGARTRTTASSSTKAKPKAAPKAPAKTSVAVARSKQQ